MGRKSKLSKQQQMRVRANQERALARRERKQDQQTDEAYASLLPQHQELEHGRVISRFGQHADILDDQGQIQKCHIRRTVGALVTGDKVAWLRTDVVGDGFDGVVQAVEPRQNQLERPDIYDGLRLVAANIDLIVIVTTCQPVFSDQMIDRYLIACHHAGIEPLLVFNKADLLEQAKAQDKQAVISRDQALAIEQRMAFYQTLGYPVLFTHQDDEASVTALRAAIEGKTTILVGQSGVGKSSLINAMIPQAQAHVGDVSSNSGLGQHTTTVSRWYALANQTAIIDSPGIREFGLWHLTPEQISAGFIEFAPFIGACKFRDCKHQSTPGCALEAAEQDGLIDSQRLANFLYFIESSQS